MYKLTLKNIDDPEDALEKALKEVRGERQSGEIQDDYLKYLAEYADALYVKITDAMIQDILDVLYGDKTKKAIKSVRLNLDELKRCL